MSNTPDHKKENKILKMPSVSEYPSRKEWEKASWQTLSHSTEWLHHMVTPYERRNFVLRVAVAHRLDAGMSYREIGRELWLSSQTISTIKKALREQGYRSYTGRAERKKKVHSVIRARRSAPRMGAPHKTKYGTVYF